MNFKAIAVACAALLVPSAAAAQPQCAPRQIVIERLTNDYRETRQSVGLAQGNRVIEVFASTESGSWTITVTHPNGTTCLVAAGVAFETLAEAPPPSGTAS